MTRWQVVAVASVVSMSAVVPAVDAAAQTGTVSGVVVDPSGGAIVAAEIRVRGAGGEARATTTDTKGQFVVGALPPGRWTVEVRQRLFEARRVDMEVSADGAPTVLRVELALAGVAETFTVTGPTSVTRSGTAATKTDVPLLETPRAVQIVARQYIDDRQATSILDVVKNVSGIQAPPGGYYDNFYIRGFSTVVDTYRDGLRLNSMRGAPDMAFVDHVEVSKGPSSMLFGRVQPGGLVNTVTRMPRADAAFGVAQQLGSWGAMRTTVDATGPLNPSGTLLYRAIGAFDRGDLFVDFNHRRNIAVAGYLTWIPTSRVSLNLRVERYDKRMTNVAYAAQQIPAIGNRPANVPRNWTQNDPVMWSDFPATEKATLIPMDLTVALTRNWKITNRVGVSALDDRMSMMTTVAYAPATQLVTRRVTNNAIDRNMVTTNLDLLGSFTTIGVKHRILVGVDYMRHRTTYQGLWWATGSAVPGITLTAPVYGTVDANVLRGVIAAAADNVIYFQHLNNRGLYLQDQLSLGRRWELLLGLRRDRTFDPVTVGNQVGTVQSACFPRCTGALDPATPVEHANSPNAGLLYKVSSRASVYASYAKSFGNSNGSALTFDGTRPPPQTGIQYEVGAKMALLNERVTGSITAFDLRQRNRMTPDLDHVGFSVPLGEVRNKGVEFDLAGQVSRHVNLIASYTYTDARITSDNTRGVNATLGKRWSGVPWHSSSFWVKYDSAPGRAAGWAVGGGAYLNGLRQGNNTNTFQLPGYARVDGLVSYRVSAAGRPMTAQLNVQNLLDARYFEATDGAANSYYGQPRSVSTSIRFDF